MGISDVIASFIQSALDETDGVLELQRSDLAQRFNCVPSQINYVMSTRFSPEHGYIVESRRGGNGYIRITRVRTDARHQFHRGQTGRRQRPGHCAESGGQRSRLRRGRTVAAGSHRRQSPAPRGSVLSGHAAGRYFQAGIDPFGLIFQKEVMIDEM